jgi:hypothetical protein
VRTCHILLLAFFLAGFVHFGIPGSAHAQDAALIAKGEYLARAGDCIACHTNPGDAPFAGGLPMPTRSWPLRHVPHPDQ